MIKKGLLLFIVLIITSCGKNGEKVEKTLYPSKIIYKNTTAEKIFEILPIEFLGERQGLKSNEEEISFKYNGAKLQEILIVNRKTQEIKISHKFNYLDPQKDFIENITQVKTYIEKETKPRYISEYIKYINFYDINNNLSFLKVFDNNENLLEEYFNELYDVIIKKEYDFNGSFISETEISFKDDVLFFKSTSNTFPSLYNSSPYKKNNLNLFNNNLIDEIKITFNNGSYEFYKYDYNFLNNSLFQINEVKENGKTITIIEYE